MKVSGKDSITKTSLATKPMQLLGHDIGIHATILVVAEDGD